MKGPSTGGRWHGLELVAYQELVSNCAVVAVQAAAHRAAAGGVPEEGSEGGCLGARVHRARRAHGRGPAPGRVAVQGTHAPGGQTQQGVKGRLKAGGEHALR